MRPRVSHHIPGGPRPIHTANMSARLAAHIPGISTLAIATEMALQTCMATQAQVHSHRLTFG